MLDTRPYLLETDFPPIKRGKLETLQLNMGYRCNLSCTHCHVNAGPRRTEQLTEATLALVLEFIDRHAIKSIDLTGGAPEMNPLFKTLVREARQRGMHVMDRCNLTILLEPGFEDMADFLAEQQVEVVASLPCYTQDNVDAQRGKGVFDGSIEALQRLNALGYGHGKDHLQLSLVYNPGGAFLPPPQDKLEADYKRELAAHFGIYFDQLYAITNMPISRFGSVLLSKGTFDEYLSLLKSSYSADNLKQVMCRSLVSVDWQGYVYDCDFNQMLHMPMFTQGASGAVIATDHPRVHLSELLDDDLEGRAIHIGEHCWGCTAGQGSSCGGALDE